MKIENSLQSENLSKIQKIFANREKYFSRDTCASSLHFVTIQHIVLATFFGIDLLKHYKTQLQENIKNILRLKSQ